MDMQVDRDTSSSAYIDANLKFIDLTIKLRLAVSRLSIGQSTLHDGLQDLLDKMGGIAGIERPKWVLGCARNYMKLSATTEAENYRARIDTLEQRNSDLEKQVTALQLQIKNGSADIATPLTSKRKCVALSGTHGGRDGGGGSEKRCRRLVGRS